MKGRRGLPLAVLSLILLLSWFSACGGAAPSSPGLEETAGPAPDLQAQAAAEATAIIQQAQATALVLQAQAQATALLQRAQAVEPAPAAPPTWALPALAHTPQASREEEPTAPSDAENPEATPETDVIPTVELLRVGFAADGAFLIANYKAPPIVAQTFWPGVLSVTDEASGTVFEEVPVMPVIGPLIGRPVEEGQVGYVMFVHAPAILQPGAVVTVVLGDYTFEHVPVQ